MDEALDIISTDSSPNVRPLSVLLCIWLNFIQWAKSRNNSSSDTAVVAPWYSSTHHCPSRSTHICCHSGETDKNSEQAGVLAGRSGGISEVRYVPKRCEVTSTHIITHTRLPHPYNSALKSKALELIIAGSTMAASSVLARFAGAFMAAGTLFFVLCYFGVQGQTISNFCEGELGEANWECGALALVPAQVPHAAPELATNAFSNLLNASAVLLT